MKLVHFELSGVLLDDKTNFTEWIIESPDLFSEYVIELHSQIEGAEGRFVLSEQIAFMISIFLMEDSV